MTANLLVAEMMFWVSKTSQHSGKIHVDSEKKKTIFTIVLEENSLVKLEHFLAFCWLHFNCCCQYVMSHTCAFIEMSHKLASYKQPWNKARCNYGLVNTVMGQSAELPMK